MHFNIFIFPPREKGGSGPKSFDSQMRFIARYTNLICTLIDDMQIRKSRCKLKDKSERLNNSFKSEIKPKQNIDIERRGSAHFPFRVSSSANPFTEA